MTPSDSRDPDVDALVRDQFGRYLALDGMSLDSQVIADAGVDSIVLVTILTDLLMELNLDVADVEVKLSDLRTLRDVASLIESMLARQRAAI